MTTEYTSKTCSADDGTELYYREYSGPTGTPHTIICLPGLMRNSRDFEEIASHLSHSYRVLACDLRGRGFSGYAKDPMTYQPPQYVKDVKAVLDSAGVKEAIFLGTSLGGLVTMMSAGLMRERVKAAILNDIGPQIEEEGLAGIQQNIGVGDPVNSWDAAAAITKERNGHVFPAFSDEDWITMATRLWREVDGQIRLDYDFNIGVPFKQAGPVAGVDLWPLFRALDGLPLLVVRGSTSNILSEDVFTQMKQEVPSMVQVWADGIGHAPYLTEPDVQPAIDGFLAKVPERRGFFSAIAKKIRSVILRWSLIMTYAKAAKQAKQAAG